MYTNFRLRTHIASSLTWVITTLLLVLITFALYPVMFICTFICTNSLIVNTYNFVIWVAYEICWSLADSICLVFDWINYLLDRLKKRLE